MTKNFKKLFMKLHLNEFGKYFRKKFRNSKERKKLKNHNFSIISNTCIGGIIYNDMNHRFLTPTINLYIKPVEFVRLLENFEYYMSLGIQPVDTKLKYPVGRLGDITLFFKHYNSIEEAIQKWDERKKRINYDNMYIMMTDRWCCPYEYIKRFDELKFKNKVCFTYKEYNEFKSCKIVKKWRENGCVGTITDVANIFGKRLYQYAKNFNYIEWLNSGRK